MTKEKWIEHMEANGIDLAPSHGGDGKAWHDAITDHRRAGCRDCADRAKTRKATSNRKTREQVYRDAGLVKVYGAVTGRVYWE